MSVVGALGSRRRAVVDPAGAVQPSDTGWDLTWWIGADDRWRVPTREAAVRQTLVDGMPVVQTAMRVPGGDAVARVYGVVTTGDPLVLEIENDSPAPFVVALTLRGARTVAVEDRLVWVDGRPGLIAPRAPSRWATGATGSTEVLVCSGQARDDAFTPLRSRGARGEAAFLHPVPHRTTIRVALPGGREVPELDPRQLPPASDVAHAWRAQLDRGLRVALPDPSLGDAVDRARAQVLLAGTGPSPRGGDVAALEDWGLDDEALDAWRRVRGRERRRAAQRLPQPGIWSDIEDAPTMEPADLLTKLRSLLVHEHRDVVTILSELPVHWRGGPIDVRDAPVRAGRISYAVRWHGERPALLWEGPAGITLRAPGLDADWTTSEERGEALLGIDGSAA